MNKCNDCGGVATAWVTTEIGRYPVCDACWNNIQRIPHRTILNRCREYKKKQKQPTRRTKNEET